MDTLAFQLALFPGSWVRFTVQKACGPRLIDRLFNSLPFVGDKAFALRLLYKWALKSSVDLLPFLIA